MAIQRTLRLIRETIPIKFFLGTKAIHGVLILLTLTSALTRTPKLEFSFVWEVLFSITEAYQAHNQIWINRSTSSTMIIADSNYRKITFVADIFAFYPVPSLLVQISDAEKTTTRRSHLYIGHCLRWNQENLS